MSTSCSGELKIYHFLPKFCNLPEMNEEYSYIFYTFFKNLQEMKEKPPWYQFEIYHMYELYGCSIPIYPLQRIFYPQNLACTPKNDEVPYMLLNIEGIKIRNETKCTPYFKMKWEPWAEIILMRGHNTCFYGAIWKKKEIEIITCIKVPLILLFDTFPHLLG